MTPYSIVYNPVPFLRHSPTANMDQMMGGGDGGMGGQAGFPLEMWFWEMPLCTRWWTTATVLTSALVQCQIVTPFQLFYSFRAVFVKNQVRSSTSNFLQINLTPDHSTGDSSPHSSILAPCHWILSSTSSSSRDTRDYLKSRLGDLRRISPGCYSTQRRA